jgi:hypothetical protein
MRIETIEMLIIVDISIILIIIGLIIIIISAINDNTTLLSIGGGLIIFIGICWVIYAIVLLHIIILAGGL